MEESKDPNKAAQDYMTELCMAAVKEDAPRCLAEPETSIMEDLERLVPESEQHSSERLALIDSLSREVERKSAEECLRGYENFIVHTLQDILRDNCVRQNEDVPVFEKKALPEPSLWMVRVSWLKRLFNRVIRKFRSS
jgi:hypothetical protein